MGLISETVEITWQRKMCKYYINLGYKFTKYGDIFEVKVDHLSNSSNVCINVKCDGKNCENPYLKPIPWVDYKKHVKNDGKYYCKKCSQIIFGIKTRLNNGKSFEKWCINNNFQYILDYWDYELNDCKPSEITYSTNKNYYFKCPRGIHESELKNIYYFTRNKKSSMDCNQCNSFAQYLIDNFGNDALEKYWDYNKNTVNPWKISYSSSQSKIWIKCQEKDYHESYDLFRNGFVSGNRCPYCSGISGKVHPLDSLGKLLEDKGLLHLWSDKNQYSPYDYTPMSHQEVGWKCSEGIHEDYFRDINDSNKLNFRCPDCVRERDESFLQEKVRLYLNELKYIVLHENKCTIIPINPKTNYQLPFDNEIKELKLIVEVHGKQHYEISGWNMSRAKKHNITPKQELEYQQLKDKYKNYFALSQGYFYLEIPYWTDDSEETWKKLIDDKINEIININFINIIKEEKEVS